MDGYKWTQIVKSFEHPEENPIDGVIILQGSVRLETCDLQLHSREECVCPEPRGLDRLPPRSPLSLWLMFMWKFVTSSLVAQRPFSVEGNMEAAGF